MAGVKGRSGRRSIYEERTIAEILELSATLILKWLKAEEIPLDKKIPVIANFISKRIPSGDDVPGATKIINIINAYRNTDNTARSLRTEQTQSSQQTEQDTTINS